MHARGHWVESKSNKHIGNIKHWIDEDDAINSIKWEEQTRQATYFQQVRQTRISLYFSFPYFRAHICCRTIKNSSRRKS